MKRADGLEKLGTELAALLGETGYSGAASSGGDQLPALLELAGRLRVKEEQREAVLRERTFQLELVLDILRRRDQALAEQAGWDFASDLQRSMLPQNFPPFPDRGEFDIYAGMVTAKEVGGDLYDFFLLTPDRLGFVIADAAGKGLPAAVFITMTQTLLRAAAQRLDDPGHCLATVNAMLCLENPTAMFTTAFYGILDTGTGLIRYANAGHNPPLVLRADAGVEELPATDAMALGVFEDVDYPVRLAQLNPGDSLLCFTDGVTEAINGAGDLFGDERLAALLAHQAHQHPMEIFAGVITDVDGYMGLAPMADDVTLLVLRYNG